jgi:hypothetical protein
MGLSACHDARKRTYRAIVTSCEFFIDNYTITSYGLIESRIQAQQESNGSLSGGHRIEDSKMAFNADPVSGIAGNVSSGYPDITTSVSRFSSNVRGNNTQSDAVEFGADALFHVGISEPAQVAGNIANAISTLQAAQETEKLISKTLLNMKELAQQAANTSLRQQRKTIQRKFNQLASAGKQATAGTGQAIDLNIKATMAAAGYVPVDPKGALATMREAAKDYAGFRRAFGDVTIREQIGTGNIVDDPKGVLAIMQKAMRDFESYRDAVKKVARQLESLGEAIASHAEKAVWSEPHISGFDMANEIASTAASKIRAQPEAAAQAHSNSIIKLAGKLLI